MSSIVVNGDTSGSVTLSAPATAGTVTVTLPSASGTMAVSGGSTSFTDLSYTGTLTGGTGVVNLGSGQVYKDASGNVGIGTSSPVGKLHVEGGSENAIIGSSTRKIYFRADSGGIGLLDGAAQTGNGFYVNSASSYVATYTGNSERARIDSSGNLLVGTTSNVGTGRISINPTAGGNNCINSASASNGYYVGIFYTNTSTTAGYIVTGGSTTSYVTSSDYRLKEAVTPMIGALAKVAALKPVTYKWKSDGSDGQGFIAHELQAVVPDCVHGEKDAVNEDGSIKPQGIDTSFLVATLTAAIQELKAIVDAQGAEIAALKGAI